MITLNTEQIKDLEDVKIALKQVETAINLLSEKKIERADTVYKLGGTGPVVKGTDGNWYRIAVEGTSTISVTTQKVGKNPTGE
jgi:hypothetical protein